MQGVKPDEQVAVAVVDAAVGFVGNDEVEEAGIELFEALHHGRISGEVDARRDIARRVAADEDARLAGQVFLEHVVGLLAQFAAVGEEKDPLGPTGTDQQFAQRHGDTGLAGAGGQDDEGFAVAAGEALGDAA